MADILGGIQYGIARCVQSGVSVVQTLANGVNGFKEKISDIRDKNVSNVAEKSIQNGTLTEENSINNTEAHNNPKASRSLPDRLKNLTSRVRHLSPRHLFSKQNNEKSAEAPVHSDPPPPNPLIEKHVSLSPGSRARSTHAEKLYELLPKIKENTIKDASYNSPKEIHISGFQAAGLGEVIGYTAQNPKTNFLKLAVIGYDKVESKYYLETPISEKQILASSDVKLNEEKLTDGIPRRYLKDGENSITIDGQGLFNIKLPFPD